MDGLVVQFRWPQTYLFHYSAIKPPRAVGNRNSEPSEEHTRFITHRRRMEEKQEDEAFLSTFKTNNSVELIDCFKDKL